MLKLKLPNIKAQIASEVKPMNTMVKSITSKLKGKKVSVPKLKGAAVSMKIQAVKPMKMPSMKMPSFVFKKK